MSSERAITRIVDALDSVGANYMFTGSLASTYYGTARCTFDADIVVAFDEHFAENALEPIGRLSCRPMEVDATRSGCSVRRVFGFAEGPGAVNVFPLTCDPHDQARFARRRKRDLLGRRASVIAADDLVVTKLRWIQAAARPKDLVDARVLIAIQRNHLDWPYIRSWCERHGSLTILEDILRDLPDV